MNDLGEALRILIDLYGEFDGQITFDRLRTLINQFQRTQPLGEITSNKARITEKDAILITYGDQVQQPDKSPLGSLFDFCNDHLTGIFSSIHILPFYPFSSDDGFSVIDYRNVDAKLGNWEDINRLGTKFKLMFDAVFNHTSTANIWFKRFLQDDPKYKEYFIVVEGDPDLSQVVRPRALPLLTRFETPSGMKKVWTTFSPDQADLNYHHPEVILEVIEILLFYVSQGAKFIRLDAIAYIWKDIGTPCLHLPQTHGIIQLMRIVLNQVAPHVSLITETNVPHQENISYFGDGYNEAQLVYNFALPPLVLYSFYTGNAKHLTRWACGLKLASEQVTFLNFLASHDGIGINPIRGILTEDEIGLLIQKTLEHGGLISYKTNIDGKTNPYELNINYFDALSKPGEEIPIELQVSRFITAHAIMLSLIGLPGIYFHSLVGSRGWLPGVQITGNSRAINRQKLHRIELESELANPNLLRYLVFNALRKLLTVRTKSPAFHPFGGQRVIDCGISIFALVRFSPDLSKEVLCIHNVSNQACLAKIDLMELNYPISSEKHLSDLISGDHYTLGSDGLIGLEPFQTLWLDVSDI